MRLIIRNYITLGQLVNYTDSDIEADTPELPESFTLEDFLTSLGGFSSTLHETTDAQETVFRDYIYLRNYMSDVDYIDNEEFNPEEYSGRVIASRIIAWLRDTSETYEQELAYWTAAKGKLMDELTSSNQLDFSDAPQSSNPALDTYITTRTVSKSKSDVMTKIQRLREIDINIKNIYTEWSKSFEKNFVVNY